MPMCSLLEDEILFIEDVVSADNLLLFLEGVHDPANQQPVLDFKSGGLDPDNDFLPRDFRLGLDDLNENFRNVLDSCFHVYLLSQ